jgi:CRISPR system Cascade subunit CasB
MTRGDICADWWRGALADRESGVARGLAARLRRADALGVLAEPAVQALARRLGMGPADAPRLIRLAQVLADLRADDRASLAQRLSDVLSPLRFQRLMRLEGEEFTTQLRRAIVMADRRCDVARLAGDLLAWDHPDRGDRARAHWCFDYFGGALDASPVTSEEKAG